MYTYNVDIGTGAAQQVVPCIVSSFSLAFAVAAVLAFALAASAESLHNTPQQVG